MNESGFYEEHTRGWLDALALLGVFGVSLLLLWWWSYPTLHPLVWEEVAIGAGIRPPESPFPGIYRGVLRLLFLVGSAGGVLEALPWIGHVVVACATTGVYVVFRDILPSALRVRAHMGRIGARIGRLVAAVGALLFLCAEPVWRNGQVFTPTTVLIMLVVCVIMLFFSFLRRGVITPLYFCFGLLGVLSAETTLGFVLLVIVSGGVVLAANLASNPEVPLVNPFVDDLVREVVFKRLTYVWGLGFLVTVSLNVWLFRSMGGVEAVDGSGGVLNLLFIYFKNGWEATTSAIAPTGWLFLLLFSVSPFVFAVRLLPRAWDDDRFLPFFVGALYGVMGLVALSQLTGVRLFWFWTWLNGRSMVPSDATLAFLLLFNVATVVFALAVFGVDACCRNYRRLVQQQCPEAVQGTDARQVVDALGKARLFRLRMFWVVFAVVPFLVVPGRRQEAERGMLGVIGDYVREVLRETDSCDTVFTDGEIDALLELEALRAGRTLNCLALVEPHTPRTRLMRLRASAGEEDVRLLENDAATALRTWVVANPKRMARTAVQIGFEIWRRNTFDLPPFSGLVALPGGVHDEGEHARACSAVTALADRIYALTKRFALARSTDLVLRAKFPVVLFTLARIAEMRSRSADQAGRRSEAFTEAAMADEINGVNYAYEAIRTRLDWQRYQSGGQLTPREGLVIGLARGDFTLAGRSAGPVLRSDPDDPRANFAVGMMHYKNGRWMKAEEHLLRCLVKRPDDPAVLNNLAVVEIRLGKLDKAERHVRAALVKNPDIDELKRTLTHVEEARKAKIAPKAGMPPSGS